MEIDFQNPHSEMKVIGNDTVFSNWVNVNKKVPILNSTTMSKSLEVIYCFFDNQNLRALEKTSQFFFRFISFITFIQLSVGYN